MKLQAASRVSFLSMKPTVFVATTTALFFIFSPGNLDHPQPSLWWPTPSDGPLPTIQHKAGTHKTVEVQTSLGHFLKGMTYRT